MERPVDGRDDERNLSCREECYQKNPFQCVHLQGRAGWEHVILYYGWKDMHRSAIINTSRMKLV